MNAQDVLNKLASFNRNEYDSTACALLDSYAKAVAEAQEAEAVRELPLIQKLIAKCEKQLDEMELALRTKRKMSELDRENLLDKCELYRDFLKIFAVKENIYDEIAASIDATL